MAETFGFGEGFGLVGLSGFFCRLATCRSCSRSSSILKENKRNVYLTLNLKHIALSIPLNNGGLNYILLQSSIMSKNMRHIDLGNTPLCNHTSMRDTTAVKTHLSKSEWSSVSRGSLRVFWSSSGSKKRLLASSTFRDPPRSCSANSLTAPVEEQDHLGF